ncbi:MAG: nuclear transport factor 2 family protein [Pseudomonadota bacterium]
MQFDDKHDRADNLELRALIERYNTAVMSFDADAWAATWHPNASWQLPGAPKITGRDNILVAWKQAMSAFEFVGFFASAGPLEIAGDNASGTWFQQETLIGKDGSKRRIIGRYEDSYTRDGGSWRFASRDYTVLNVEEF